MLRPHLNPVAVISLLFTLFLSSAFWMSAARVTRAQPENDLKADLVRLERREWDALKKKDATALGAILAQDYFDFGSDGREDRTFSLTKGYMSQGEDLNDFLIEDAQVKVLDDHTALLTYRGTYHETIRGKSNSGSGFYSDLFQKQNGKWLSVFTQDSNLKCAGM